jgi:NAD(P)-dependent dehydrogenase (short-subunit alcohol dehydrogenase family)
MPDRQLTWLITGCSSGFGLALTNIAQSYGHRVIATSRNPSRTPELVAKVENAGGKWLKLDVNDANCAHLINNLEASGEHIDILVNNAGSSVHACVEQFAEEEVRGQMESMYFGPARLMREAVAHMRKRRFGIVVNISSGAGLEGRESMGAYAPAKAALDSEYLFPTIADS